MRISWAEWRTSDAVVKGPVLRRRAAKGAHKELEYVCATTAREFTPPEPEP